MTEPLGEPGPVSFLDSLGPRGQRRAEPRTSIAIAGAGCALAVLGVLLVSGDAGTSGGGDFNRVPGIILSALVVGAGYFTLAGTERGPVATAGAVAAALGVPPLMFFLTFDQDGFPPYSTEGILYVSTIAWLVTYAIGPARGRPLFLSAGLLGLWASVLQLTEEVFDAPFALVGGFATSFDATVSFDETGSVIGGPNDAVGGGFGEGFPGGGFDYPDPTTIGILSLGFGLAYLLLSRRLDRKGHHGAATPFALATLPALFVGTVSMSDDLQQAGTGLLLMGIGLGLAYHGATVWRRATAWIGGAVTALGAAVFLADMSDDATLVGLLYLAAGIGLVFAGHALGRALHEPDELLVTVGGATMSVAGTEQYAPGWTPPPADVPPGRWNPPASQEAPPPLPHPPPPPAGEQSPPPDDVPPPA
jgi:uncharacterized membrane protein YidH (DUF202 family)